MNIIKNIYMWHQSIWDGSLSILVRLIFSLLVSLFRASKTLCFSLSDHYSYCDKPTVIHWQ
ncbi:hypothetical protein FNJ41_24965 [Escherichia coli]|nr:hypothetical protein [Escherichia coli]EFD7795970.1 hypothetical protein [Escherichia coli]EFH3490481.1 hypothetical protein [Escherichia coli]EFH7028114.1 hypothetical protein [Escherichia coli]